MQKPRCVVVLFFVLAFVFVAPMFVAAAAPETGLEPLINQWRTEIGTQPLKADKRLYAAAEELAGDGTYCPQDRVYVEFAIAEAFWRVGYADRRGYGLFLCGQYPTAEEVMAWIRHRGGPSHPDLEHIGVVHLAGLDVNRGSGALVSDIWVLLSADPMD